MRFAMLGPLDVRGDDDRPIEVGGARLRALLVRLALDAGRLVTVESLIDGLWGETPPASAVNAVQSLVSRLRRALANGGPAGGDALIEGLPAGYRLAISPRDVDVHRFDELAGAGRRALAADPARAAELLGEALALWRGPALADAVEAPFAAAPAARLEDRRLAATEDRIAADLALGRHAEIVTELDALAAAHPLRERLQAQRITALYGAGRQAEALAAYDRTRRTLADELGVDPSAELTSLHLAVLRRDPALNPTAAKPAGEQPRTNLRAALTSFVGREEEVERVGKLLDEARLVTLVGPGGAGKTRLATESAAELTGRSPDGVWFVELAPVGDPAGVPQAILAALGLREVALLERTPGPPQDAVARLVDTLAEKRLLLILDNCEHLVEVAAEIANELLAACPDLRILATSREPLGITGETVCPVPPLGLPVAAVTPEDALACPAVRLFADRAAAVRLGFGVESSNVDAVAEICRRLDGMPLAIELAAARLRSLSAEQIAERLGDRFRLLTGGSRTALPRHQTLRAVVAWSWDLLSEPERMLARRLSAFPGGATLESVEEVCGRDGIAADAVLDLLTALVDKSFVTAVELGGNHPGIRYRMLETVRAYSAERLAEAGEEDAVRATHARHFVALAETAEPLLRGRDQLVWADRLGAEHDNLRATLRWAVDAGDAEAAVRLVAAMGWLWVLRGNHAEAAAWLAEALAIPGELTTATRAVAYAYRAMHDAASGDTGRAKESMEIARAAAHGLDRPGAHPVMWFLEPVAALVGEDLDAGKARLARVIAEADPWTAAMALLARGHVADNYGDVAAAERDFTASLAAFGELDERWGVSISLSSLANLLELKGDYAGAADAIERALVLISTLGSSEDLTQLRIRRAISLGRQGEVAAGLATLEEVVAGNHAGESRELQMMVAVAHGELDRRAGDVESARRHLEHALERFEAGLAAPHHTRAIVLTGLSYVALAEGDHEGAAAHGREAMAVAKAAKDMSITASAVDALGAAVLARGYADRAAVLFGAAAQLRGAPDLGNPDVRLATTAARAALGDEPYASAYGRAAGLSHEQVFELVSEVTPAA